MKEFLMAFTIYICLVPVAIVMYFYMYPKNWKTKNRILGVNNRKEFKEGNAAEFIDILNAAHRKQALVITVGIVIVSTIILFIPEMFVKMIASTLFVYVALILLAIPYALGNAEMKRYKKNLGILSENNIYADLKTVGSIHALNKPLLIVLNIIGLLILAAAVLIDTGVIPVSFAIFKGTFMVSTLILAFEFTNLILFPISFMVDNSRNEVICEDSNVNANYNRAKKKIFADMMILSTIINTAFSLICLLAFKFISSEMSSVLLVILYMFMLFGVIILFCSKKKKLEEKYSEYQGNLVEDDDDNWILGIFYYNPKDKKLNVEKRVGVGWTVNMAHPVGKILTVILALTVVGSLLSMVWIGLMGFTPIRIIEKDDSLICHQLWDEYTIKTNDILSVSSGDLSTLHAIRVAGTGMDNVAKGNFNVNDGEKCKLFLNPKVGKYIRIETSDQIYYISADTLEETEALLEHLQ